MSVPAREVPAYPRRVTSLPPIRPRAVTRRRAGVLFLVAAIVAQLTMLTLPLAASAPAIVAAAQPTPETITLVSGGGSVTTDPSVTYSLPAGPSNSPAAASGPAMIMPPGEYPVSGAYATPIAGTRWINTTGLGNVTSDQASSRTATYSIDFTLPRRFWAPSISIELMSDNCAIAYLNGIEIGQQPQSPCDDPTHFTRIWPYSNSTAANFRPGLNTLSIANTDGGGPNGVDFKAVVTYNPPLVANGGFELPVLNTTTFGTRYGGSTEVTGWTVGLDSVDHIGGYWPAADGAQSIDLAGIAAGSISQTLATVDGQQYELTFAYSLNGDRTALTSGGPSMTVTANGAPLGGPVTHALTTRTKMAWLYESRTFTATGASTTLAFKASPDSGAMGIALDDVSVVPVLVQADVPFLYRAFPATGGGVTVQGVIHADPNKTYQVQILTSNACSAARVLDSPTNGPTIEVVTDAAGNAQVAHRLIMPDLPTYLAAQVVAYKAGLDWVSMAGSTQPGPCVVVSEPNENWPWALPIDGNATKTGYLDVFGRSRWYKFPVQPGGRVHVTLSNLPEDFDLYVFKDIGQVYTSTASLAQLSAEFAPPNYAPPNYAPPNYAPDSYAPPNYAPPNYAPPNYAPPNYAPPNYAPPNYAPPNYAPPNYAVDAWAPPNYATDTFAPPNYAPPNYAPPNYAYDAYSSAQTRSLVAWNVDEGTASASLDLNTWTNTGDYYIRVTGKYGKYDLQHPFTINVTSDPNVCTGVGPIGPAPAAAAGTGQDSVILWDQNRIVGTDAEKAALATQLDQLVLRTDVNGVAVDVGSDGRVIALNSQADAHQDCVYAKNLVASAIKDIVDSYRVNNPLKYVVLVGGDSTIPFFRYRDPANLGPESDFVPPVGSSTASEASLRSNYVLGQDEYGSRTVLSFADSTFPVPDLAVGRVVETAAEATKYLTSYMPAGQTTLARNMARSSLVTGYDFLADAAGAVQTELIAGMTPGSPADSLIAPNGQPPTASWTANQLRPLLFGTRHDLIYLAGHFSASELLAADFATTINSSEVVASQVDLRNTVVFSAGCHSGYNLVDADGIPGVTQQLDWAQAFAQKGATLIAGTGYQYGDTDFMEYSERIYAEFAHQLRVGNDPTGVAVGQALVASKLAYLANTPEIFGLHEKALLESALFGLPMFRVNMPNMPNRVTPSDPRETLGSTGTVAPLSWGELSTTSATSPTTQQNKTLASVAAGSSPIVTTWFSGRSGVTTNAGAPALPLDVRNVTAENNLLRGVLFLGGSYRDITQVTPVAPVVSTSPVPLVPLTGAAGTDQGSTHEAFASPTFFPEQPWSVSYFGALSGGATKLLLTPAQHRVEQYGTTNATLRLYSGMNVRLFYLDSSVSSRAAVAVVPPPSIAAVSASVAISSVAISTVTFRARLFEDTLIGVHEAIVTYTTGPGADGSGTWVSLPLARSNTDPTLWTSSVDLAVGVDASNVRFMVQAVNKGGLVSLDNNGGSYHSIGTGASTTAAATSLALDASPATGQHRSSVSISATLTTGVVAVAGKMVTFRIGTAKQTAITGPTGLATASLPLVDAPGTYLLTASFNGDATGAASAASRSFEIVKIPTAVSLVATASTPTFGGSSGIMATVTASGTGAPVVGRTVIFVITGASSATTTAMTDFAGRAFLTGMPPATGTYSITACFAGPAVQGCSAAAGAVREDDIYSASGSASGSATPLSYSQTQYWKFTGFFSPVDNPTVVNVAKAGSAVPIKFSINGSAGLGIIVPGWPKVTNVACDAGLSLDIVEEIVAASNSGLKYDATSKQYNYVWKTTSTMVSNCYILELKLVDGTTRYAQFKFIK